MKKISSSLFSDFYQTQQIIENVYVHLPFCQKKCHFCAFPVHTIGTKPTQYTSKLLDSYITYLQKQIAFSKAVSPLLQSLKSLYFGGGTPSLYKVDHIVSLCSLFSTNSQTQITMEINPTQLAILPQLIRTKVSKYSFGIQTFNNQILDKMNRNYTKTKYELIDSISSYRPSQISVDFILDFNVNQSDFDQMIQFIKIINPEHVTIYILQTNQGSQLYNNPKNFSWLPKDDLNVDRYIELSHKLAQLGYEHYQISNFAKSSKNYSVHSSTYWEGDKQYLAFGMGATSFINQQRVTRPRSISKYYRFVEALAQLQQLDFQQLGLQINSQKHLQIKLQSVLMSGLRRKCGIPWEKLRHLCGEDFKRISELIIKQLEQIESFRAGLINWGLIDSKIGLTVPNGFLFADEITARLIQALKVKHFDIIYKNK